MDEGVDVGVDVDAGWVAGVAGVEDGVPPAGLEEPLGFEVPLPLVVEGGGLLDGPLVLLQSGFVTPLTYGLEL